jgi:hypothetical protein
MLRANDAVRLGLRAASRNPELAFGKALLDLAGSALSLLPLALAAAFIAAAAGNDEPLAAALHIARLVRGLALPLVGALLAAAALSWTLSMLFWAGALPLLAADTEMNARPPPGNFLRLSASGFSRTAGAGAVGAILSLGFTFGTSSALLAGALAFGLRHSRGILAALAALAAFSVLAGAGVDLLARLMLVRTAALGDSVSAAFSHAVRLLGQRLGACFAIAAAFCLLELVVAAAAAALTGSLNGSFDPARAIVAVAPRLAIGIASACVLAWLETGRQGALAALAADAEGLIEHPPEPVARRIPEPWELRPPKGARAPPAEEVIEAEPVLDANAPAEPVIEALPAPDEGARLPEDPGRDEGDGKGDGGRKDKGGGNE